VAYHLKLPASSSIHPVVHVSQLKLATGFKGTVSSELPSNYLEYCVPVMVMGSQMVSKGADQVSQVLVQLSELPPELATWEDHDALRQLFPGTLAWGQAAFQEGGNVSIVTTPVTVGPRRSSRPRKANVKVSGPMWC
jgi:hypothetical protein